MRVALYARVSSEKQVEKDLRTLEASRLRRVGTHKGGGKKVLNA